MTDSHNQTNINLAPNQGLTQVVFAPNGSSAEGDGLTYSDFGTVVDQISDFPGQYEIIVDPGPPPANAALPTVTIPPGTYDFEHRVRLVGAQAVNPVIITGVVFQNLIGARDIDFQHAGTGATAPFESNVAGDTEIIEFVRCTFDNLAGATLPIIRATGAGGFWTIYTDGCRFTQNSVEPIDAEDALSQIRLFSRSTQFGSNAQSVMSGLGTIEVDVDSASTLWPDVQSIDATGTLTVNREDGFYVAAADTANWVNPDPRNYQDAISRIAAAVAGALGAIP